MRRLYSEIIGSQFKDTHTGEVLALLKDLIIDPETGKVEAFWVKPMTVPLSNAIIQVQDVLDWKKHIYVKGEQVIADPADVIRITDILEKKRLFMGNSVRGEAGDQFGRVYNLDFDSKTYYLKNISTQKSVLGIIGYDSRIFSYSRIVEVLENEIIVDDNILEEEIAETQLDTSITPAV